MGLGAATWRAIISGLNATLAVTAAVLEAITDLDVPSWVWVLWMIASVAFLVYSTHLTAKDNARRAAAADRMIADLMERARKNGAAK